MLAGIGDVSVFGQGLDQKKKTNAQKKGVGILLPIVVITNGYKWSIMVNSG